MYRSAAVFEPRRGRVGRLRRGEGGCVRGTRRGEGDAGGRRPHRQGGAHTGEDRAHRHHGPLAPAVRLLPFRGGRGQAGGDPSRLDVGREAFPAAPRGARHPEGQHRVPEGGRAERRGAAQAEARRRVLQGGDGSPRRAAGPDGHSRRGVFDGPLGVRHHQDLRELGQAPWRGSPAGGPGVRNRRIRPEDLRRDSGRAERREGPQEAARPDPLQLRRGEHQDVGKQFLWAVLAGVHRGGQRRLGALGGGGHQHGADLRLGPRHHLHHELQPPHAGGPVRKRDPRTRLEHRQGGARTKGLQVPAGHVPLVSSRIGYAPGAEVAGEEKSAGALRGRGHGRRGACLL